MALLLAAAGDGLTMLLLPPGGEYNPAAVAAPVLALILKLAAAMILLGLTRRRLAQFWYIRAIPPIGTAVWTFGAAISLLTLAHWPP